jgi:hypothetical protein
MADGYERVYAQVAGKKRPQPGEDVLQHMTFDEPSDVVAGAAGTG